MILDIGSGAFLMWNDISARFKREFALMHTRDHVPEHMSYLGPDGMQWARRYIDGQGNMPSYFTFYGMPSLRVLSDAEHAQCRVTETQWFLKMRPFYQDREAHHCRVVGRAGAGIGGCAATFIVDLANTYMQSPSLLEQFMDGLTQIAPVTTAHLFHSDWDVPIRRGMPPPNGREGNEGLGVLVLESFDRYALADSFEAIEHALTSQGIATHIRSSAHYALAYLIGIEEINRLKHYRRDDALIRSQFSLEKA